jgi:hypothetical protein
LALAHLDDVGLKEHVPGPVYNHIELPPEGGDLQQVDGSPEEPGEQTGEFQSKDFSHSVVVADSCQKSLRAEAEGLRRLTALRPNQVGG